MQRKPYGAMVSSTDQTPQVPFTFSIIKHYFERPAPSVRLVKSIHLRAYRNIGLSMNCNLLLSKTSRAVAYYHRMKENTPPLTNPMMIPASTTPHITASVLFLKSISRRLAASVPVHAPVPGSGIPTNKNNAT